MSVVRDNFIGIYFNTKTKKNAVLRKLNRPNLVCLCNQYTNKVIVRLVLL